MVRSRAQDLWAWALPITTAQIIWVPRVVTAWAAVWCKATSRWSWEAPLRSSARVQVSGVGSCSPGSTEASAGKVSLPPPHPTFLAARPSNWEGNYLQITSPKRLVFRRHKELSGSTLRTNNSIKTQAKETNRHFSKENTRMANELFITRSLRPSRGRCKSKPHCKVPPQTSAWHSTKRPRLEGSKRPRKPTPRTAWGQQRHVRQNPDHGSMAALSPAAQGCRQASGPSVRGRTDALAARRPH